MRDELQVSREQRHWTEGLLDRSSGLIHGDSNFVGFNKAFVLFLRRVLKNAEPNIVSMKENE